MTSVSAKLAPLLAGVVLATASALSPAAAAPPETKEIRGLQQRPDLPVRSIILRRAFPDHPVSRGVGTPELPQLPRPTKGCDKSINQTGTIGGVSHVAAQDNGICTSADIDTYVDEDGEHYVVQAGGEEAAFVITNVSNPASPMRHGPFVWSGAGGKNTYTPDVKAFKQLNANGVLTDYIALSLERLTITGFCGVTIVDVSNPASPSVVVTAIGGNWCDVHNSFVEIGPSGLGQYIYLTADATNDMRVLDISNVANPTEIGRYTSYTANNDNYVHDITVIDHGAPAGRRAYLAYWDTGVVVLNAALVTPGTNPSPIIGPNQLDPTGFLAHHAWASADGTRVFTQDEFLAQNGQEPVQMWRVDLPSPQYVDGLRLGSDVPANPAHNLEMRPDIAPNRLYVGWYKLGLRAWDFTAGSFVRSGAVPNTAVQFHQVQTQSSDDVYDGAWGVRLDARSADEIYVYQSDRRYGLIVDRVGAASPPLPGTDADGDGYFAGNQPGDDCNDNDANVHPGHNDTKGRWGRDGIDNDCNGIIDG